MAVRGRLDGSVEQHSYDPRNEHVSIKRARCEREPESENIENAKWISIQSMEALDQLQRRFVSGFAEIYLPVHDILKKKNKEERPAFRAAISTILEPLTSVLTNHMGDTRDLRNGETDLYKLWERLSERLIRGIPKVYDVGRWAKLTRTYKTSVPRTIDMDSDLPVPLNRLDLMHIKNYLSAPELPQVLYAILRFCELTPTVNLDAQFADLLILDLSLVVARQMPTAYVDSIEYYLHAREKNPTLHRWDPEKDIHGTTDVIANEGGPPPPEGSSPPDIMPGEFPEDMDVDKTGEEVSSVSPTYPTNSLGPAVSPRPRIQRTSLLKRKYVQAEFKNTHWNELRKTKAWQRDRARRVIRTQYIGDFSPRSPVDHRRPPPDLKSILRNRKVRSTPRRLLPMVQPKTVRFTDSTLSPEQRSHTGWEIPRRIDYEADGVSEVVDEDPSILDRLDNIDGSDAVDNEPNDMDEGFNAAATEPGIKNSSSDDVADGFDNSNEVIGDLDCAVESFANVGIATGVNHDIASVLSQQAVSSPLQSAIDDRRILSGEEPKERIFRRLRLHNTEPHPPPDPETGARLIDELFAIPSIVSLELSDDSKAAIALRKEQEALKAEEAARKADEEARRAKEAAQRAAEEAARRKLEARLAKSGGLRLPNQKLVGSLSADWLKRAQDTLRAANTTTLAVTGEGIDLRRHDFAKVVPETEWLNDEIVNASLNWLDKAVNTAAGIKDAKKQTRKCLAMSSFFFKQLREKGVVNFKSERTLRRYGVDKKNLLDVDTILLPICENSHWTLLVVRPSKRTVSHMDSLNPRGSTAITSLAMAWLKQLLDDDFKEAEWKVVRHEAPRQTNGWDCGVHTITNAICISLGVNAIDAYSAEDMPLQRLRIASMLLNQGFSGAFDLREF
jgi:hypothetical protein